MQNEAKLCAKMETAALNVLSTSNNEKKMEGYPFPHETQFKDLHNMTICTNCETQKTKPRIQVVKGAGTINSGLHIESPPPAPPPPKFR